MRVQRCGWTGAEQCSHDVYHASSCLGSMAGRVYHVSESQEDEESVNKHFIPGELFTREFFIKYVI